MTAASPGSNAVRRDAIVQAAAGVFLRYGHRKTSMDDLSRAAGLSRQGLYLHFATKDAIFAESVAWLAARSLDAVRVALNRDGIGIEERLLDAFTGLASHVDGSPMSRDHLVELMTTATALAGPTVAAFDDALLDELSRALRASGVANAWKGSSLSAKALARHLLFASRGIKQSSRADVDYREQMRVAVRLVCRGAEAPSA